MLARGGKAGSVDVAAVSQERRIGTAPAWPSSPRPSSPSLPPGRREKRENSQETAAVFSPEGAAACSLGLAAFCQPQVNVPKEIQSPEGATATVLDEACRRPLGAIGFLRFAAILELANSASPRLHAAGPSGLRRPQEAFALPPFLASR